MTLKALLWDVDGTLAETEDHGHRVAFNLAFKEAGLRWRWDSELYGDLLKVTGGKERLMAWLQRIDPEAAAGPEALRRMTLLHERKTAIYVDLLTRRAVGLRPGVLRLLDEAQAGGLRQAIATTTTPANVTQLIDVTLGGRGHRLFEVVGAGDAVPHKKPAPDIYRWVLERLQLEPQDCLAVEDSRMGVEAAVAAGVPVLLVRSRYTGTATIPGTVGDLPSLEGVRLQQLRDWHARALQGRAAAA
ncbi:haloacid dehalogenase [Rubrivivax gelatinosus]|nr:haloacid dehalogenase [Rubrivivax gelatinosus]